MDIKAHNLYQYSFSTSLLNGYFQKFLSNKIFGNWERWHVCWYDL